MPITTQAPTSSPGIASNPGQEVLSLSVTASSSLGSGWSASNATDGDLTTCWSSIEYSSGQLQPNNMPWIEVALNASITGGRFVLYPRWDAKVQEGSEQQPVCFPSAFQIMVYQQVGLYLNIYTSPPNFVVPSALQVGLCFRPTSYVGPYQHVRTTGQTLTDDGNEQPSNYYFQLAEIEAYTGPIPAISATSTSTYSPEWAASNLINGQFNTPWSSAYWSNGGLNSVSVTLDLGQPTAFNRIVLYPRWSASAGSPHEPPIVLGFPIKFVLYGSTNGTDWSELQAVNNFAMPQQNNTGIAIPVGNQVYQYILLDILETGTDGFDTIAQLLQIEVFQS